MKITNIDAQQVGHVLANWIVLILFNKFISDLEEEKDPQVCPRFHTDR